MSEKRLIEEYLPVEAVSYESTREKLLRRRDYHISTLHLWWARRPLAASRAAVYAALVRAPDQIDSEKLAAMFKQLCTCEGKPQECHRMKLVTEELVAIGVPVVRPQAEVDAREGVAKRARSRLGDAFMTAYSAEHLASFDARAFLNETTSNGPVCLFCIEREPAACHRSLVAAAGTTVEHLLP